MWKSDNPFIRILRVLFGFGIVAVILLTSLTVVFSFPEKSTVTNATAQVKSCENNGPISRRGFGNHWNCTTVVRDDETGETWNAEIDMNLFTPEDIGKEKRITWGYGGGRIATSENRVYSSPEGYSSSTRLVAIILAGFPAILAALWYFAKAIIWGFSQEEQRKFWEKIHGTPEERAAKKQKEREADERFRERQAEIAEARRKAKEERRQK